MAPAPSQSYRRTAGDNWRYWVGRQINDKRTERRQEEEREMHAREKWLKTWSSVRGNIGWGIEGRTRAISGRENVAHNPK